MPTPSVDDKLRHAFAQQQRGAFDAAALLYGEVLEQVPRHPYALHMLGVVRFQQGDIRAAVRLLRSAVAVTPADAAVHANLALALLAQNEPQAALEHCDRAIALRPAYPEALNNRGNALQALARHAAALDSYDRALAIRNDYAEAWYNRARTLQEMKRAEDALESYDRALALHAGYFEARYFKGNLLRRLGRHLDAIGCYDAALELRPGSAQTHNNRGNALLALGRDREALASYDRALALDAGLAEAHSNRSMILRKQERWGEALSACDAAIRCDPSLAAAFHNRGNILQDQMRLSEALECYDRAIELDPMLAEAYDNRGNVLTERRQFRAALDSYDRALRIDPANVFALSNRARSLMRMNRFDEAADTLARLLAVDPGFEFAEGALQNCRLRCCDWNGFRESAVSLAHAVRRGERVVHPFFFLATSDRASDQRRCAEIMAQAEGGQAKAALWKGERYGHERIRVALLSADFHEHATAYLIAELVEIHDRSQFEIVGISLGADDGSPMRRRLEGAFDAFLDATRMSDADVARWLRLREIDIAVDLKGYTDGARTGILAHRPAPAQVAYLGYPGTMASASIDYVIADRYVIPEGDDRYYVEKVVRLPDTYQVNDRKRSIAEVAPSRIELGLPEDGFAFCCFNNNWKILPDVFDVWMRLLHKVEGSVLWLLEDNAPASGNLRVEAERRGVAPERLVFAPRAHLPAHLARQRRADLFLDTLPYNGHTTTSDALWAGLPVLTCEGRAFAGRVGSSLLHAAGVPELVTRDLHEYEAVACSLASDPGRLAELRQRLARQRDHCALFDTDRFRRHLEFAYRRIADRSAAGLPPAGFDVPLVPPPADAG